MNYDFKKNISRVSLAGLAIFVSSLLLRIALIGKGAFHCDAMTLAVAAENTVKTGVLHYGHSHGFPLTAILAAGFFAVLQKIGCSDPVLVINFMSVVFSSLAVLVFFHVVRKVFNVATAVFSAVLLSLNPIFLGNSLYGNSHMPGLFFILSGFYWAWEFLNGEKKRSFLIYAALFFGAGLSARLQDAAVVYPTFVLFFMIMGQDGKSKRIKNILVFTGISFALCLLFYLPILWKGFQQGAASIKAFWDHELFSGLKFQNYPAALKNYWNYLKESTTLFGLGIFGLSFFFLRRPKVKLLVGFWFLSAVLAFSALAFWVPRFLIISLPALYMGIGCFLNWMFERGKWFAAVSLLTFLVLAAVPFTHYFGIFYRRHQRDYIGEHALWVKQKIEPDAYVIVGDGSIFYRRVGLRLFPRPLSEWNLKIKDLRKFKKSLDLLLEKQTPVYITCHGLLSYDRGRVFSLGMLRYYCLKLVGEHPFEFWHRGVLKDAVVPCGLFRIYPAKYCEGDGL